jgi:hypothetical protein
LDSPPAVDNDCFVTLRFAIYPPADDGLPWLAVVLNGYKPIDMFGCADRDTAEKLLREMRARQVEKNGGRSRGYTLS